MDLKRYEDLSEEPQNPLLKDVLEGIVTGGPLGEFLTDERLTGVKTLPSDKASGKTLMLIDPNHLPDDERYLGPRPWSELRALDHRADWRDLVQRITMGQHPDPGLCRRCRRMCLIRKGTFTRNKFVRFRPYGAWLQLLLRSKCRICRLAVVSLSCGTFQLHPFLREIDPEAQYSQLEPQTLPTGETVLTLEYGLRKFGVLRIVTIDNFKEVLRQAYEVQVDSPFDLLCNYESAFHDQTGQVASTELMKTWVSECEQNHVATCCETWKSSHPSDHRPILLIDVLDRCIVQKAMADVRYFTLSYVRGDSVIPATTKSNLAAWQVKLSLPANLPATIGDALTVVSRLGERYLWVDSLCILQDDLASLHSDIRRMDTMYSHAVATIVAPSGVNADSGLPGVQPGTREPQHIECPTS